MLNGIIEIDYTFLHQLVSKSITHTSSLTPVFIIVFAADGVDQFSQTIPF